MLVALSAHAALAVQAAQETAELARHRRALEQLFAVSSRLTDEAVIDEILAPCARRSATPSGSTASPSSWPTTHGTLVVRALGGLAADHPALRRTVRPSTRSAR